jgi:hypothetical protein
LDPRLTKAIISKYDRGRSYRPAHRVHFEPPKQTWERNYSVFTPAVSVPASERMFWIEPGRSSIGVMCRVCGTVVVGDANARRAHIKRAGCTKTMNKVLELLQRDPVCVVCGAKIHLRQYGVPLCYGECTSKYETSVLWGRKDFLHALRELGRNSRGVVL